ncbi:MAG: DNA cytosine methyltransferase [Pseudomonadota bacterium]
MSLSVFDFFSGCGGTSCGLKRAGLNPVFALDFDRDAATTFQDNFPDVTFIEDDITSFDSSKVEDLLQDNSNGTLFCGCAPCQPFTKQNTSKPDSQRDGRRSLLSSFGNLVENYLPDYVLVENVPGMQRVVGNSTLSRFRKRLERLDYKTTVGVVESQAYGIPQRRRRLVLIASLHGDIDLPRTTHGPGLDNPYSTVREWIAHLPPIAAGETHPTVCNHRSANLSDLNLKRIKATPPEGSRDDWPEELQLACHTKAGYTGHTDVYGRMKWDAPATGLTTRCISLSNGRYGHPVQDRAISVREAASLQTFPDSFTFSGSMNSQARQIGNAVPVLLAEALGSQILRHYTQNMDP